MQRRGDQREAEISNAKSSGGKHCEAVLQRVNPLYILLLQLSSGKYSSHCPFLYFEQEFTKISSEVLNQL